MNITNRRIRFKLEGGQWTHWLTDTEVRRYRGGSIKAVVIEETMSYVDAMKYLKVISE